MSGEGFKLAVILIVCFMFISMTSIAALSLGKIDLPSLKELFTGLGILASMFGIPAIITAWIVTRGQTGTTIITPPETP